MRSKLTKQYYLGNLHIHLHASVTKQYYLVPANGQWCSLAGKVTEGLAESISSLLPGLWLKSPRDWLPGKWDQLWAQCLSIEYGTILVFMTNFMSTCYQQQIWGLAGNVVYHSYVGNLVRFAAAKEFRKLVVKTWRSYHDVFGGLFVTGTHCVQMYCNASEEAKTVRLTVHRRDVIRRVASLTRNVVSGWAQNLAARPKRMLLAPDQLSCAPTSTFSFTFWKREPENSFPSFLDMSTNTHTVTSMAVLRVQYTAYPDLTNNFRL